MKPIKYKNKLKKMNVIDLMREYESIFIDARWFPCFDERDGKIYLINKITNKPEFSYTQDEIIDLLFEEAKERIKESPMLREYDMIHDSEEEFCQYCKKLIEKDYPVVYGMHPQCYLESVREA